MAETFKVYMFGDETGSFTEPLQKLCEHQKGVLFVHFLQEINKVLRDELRKQPRQVRAQIPEFTDVLDLIKRYRDSGSRNQILETTITCVYQLASVISYFSDQPSHYFTAHDTAFVGLCTGLLSASAVSSSQSTLDLIDKSLTTVRVAFRIGVKVSGVAQRLTSNGEANDSQSWSRLVLGAQKEPSISAVEDFNNKQGMPRATQIYVSAYSQDVVTISGPPATTDTLFQESEYFQKFKTVPLEIFGPFHAPHLYSENDIKDVMQPYTENNGKFSPSIRIISGSTEASPLDVDADQFMTDIVANILVRPLSLDGLLTEATEMARNSSAKEFRVLSVGPSRALSRVVSALEAGTALDVIMDGQLELTKPKHEPLTGAQKIAVVGMAGRFPNSDDIESFWNVLQQGLDVHRTIPPDRFNVDAHYDPSGTKKNTSHTPYGCFIEEPGLFDPRFFGISPRETYQTDPMGRLALVTAYEALEMSGFVPNRTPSSMLHRIGSFYGQTSDDWRQLNAAENIDTYYIPGTIRAFATGRINYYFKFTGPSYSVDTACSSSFSAIQLACTSLLAKECDTALAGGLNVMTTPDLFAGLSRAHFLSKTGSCKTFDDGADGFCRGDGVGTVVLKRLEDAEADNDPILGVILGTATNHSSEAVSITQPHGPAQEFLYNKILKNTGVNPLDVSYVEMHGTGTQAGDGTEMKSITNVFAPRKQGRRLDQTIHLGAIKANIGHGEASAGVASLIKTLIMLRQNAIPPHVGIKTTMNKTFPPDLKERGVRIALKETPWLRPEGGKRIAYLNNFGASGGNSGLLLEDGPNHNLASPGSDDPRTNFVISVSAKSVYSLEQNIQKLASYLESNPDTCLPQLAYTTTTRRIHHQYRVSHVVSSVTEAIKALRSVQTKLIKPVSIQSIIVAFVFSGQGALYSYLGQQLFEHSKQFQTEIMEFNIIGRKQGFPSFLPLVDGTVDIDSLSPVALQLGQLCIQMALAQLWKSWGVIPSTVIGHSLGEYAALNVAGVLSASDTIYLVGRRAQLLEELCTPNSHKMLAIAASVSFVKKTLASENIEIACINGPEQTVISGTAEELDSYSTIVKNTGTKCTLLSTPYAFHSAQVDVILERFKVAANSVHFGIPKVPVISPLLGDLVIDGGVFGPEYLCRHAREAVNFLDAIEAAKSKRFIDENVVWIEVGPAPVCSAFIKSCLGSKVTTLPSLRKQEDAWKTMFSGLNYVHSQGLVVDWEEVHREYEMSHKVLNLPSYRFENKNYWLDYNNNWCLTKGQIMEPQPRKRRGHHLSTSSVQKVTKEDFGAKIAVIAESDLSEPGLNHAVTGHLVNGSALCPAGVYAEMAMTLASFIHEKVNKSDDVGMNVCELEIVKPLIAKGRHQKQQQIVRMTATAEKPLKLVKISYNSVSTDGKLGDLHATCNVEFGDTKSWIEDWSRLAYLFRSRIDVLTGGAKVGRYKSLDRELAYKGFSSFVQYDKQYHGMKEVVIDQKNFEATSTLEFQTTDDAGDFEINPCFIDNISHLSGYILNGSGAVDTNKQVYVSHGWKSLQIAKPLSSRKTYSNYVKMYPGQKQTMFGDVYVFEGDEMVALVGGVKFQAIPRTVIDRLLPPVNGAASTSSQLVKSAETRIEGSKIRTPKVSDIVTHSDSTTKKASHSSAISLPQPQKENKSLIDGFKGIMLEELGLESSELQDGTLFVDIGLDSLMSLSITGRIREELGLESVPSSLFTDYPSVAEAISVILKLGGGLAEQTTADHIEEIKEFPTESATLSHSSDDISSKLWDIVSEEIGIEQAELLEIDLFADAGIDSLMSLTITGRAREELELDIPTSFFTSYPTVAEARSAIAAIMGVAPAESVTSESSVSEHVTPAASSATSASSPVRLSTSMPDLDFEVLEKNKMSRTATSVVLQGNTKTASKTLFLLPDGSGSATSYSFLPSIAPNLCVVGLNCPFLKNPAEFTNGIEGVAGQYLAEIRRRQPNGPYVLGGWSAGGVLAYAVAYQLLELGEQIDFLVLIDAPCPINLEPLPSDLLHFIDSLGLLGSPGATPSWLIPHFEASIRNLTDFIPYPLDPDEAPKTFIIWARNGIVSDSADPKQFPRSTQEAKSVKFLLDSRQNLGSYGWEKLVGLENITMNTLEGNHFTLLRDPEVDELSVILKRILNM